MKIWIALAITVVAVLASIWQIANIRGMKARGRRRANVAPDKAQRKGDTRVFKGAEKKLYQESQRYLEEGKIAAGARILEQLNMPREAIQALEDAGLIHEAAKILMRMQRHNRAGVVYARHGMWENAAASFKQANMPLEVAKCSREAGNFAVAAEYFEKVGRYEDAGDCLEQVGDFHRAARLFSTAGQRQRAMFLYNKLAAAAQNLAVIEFRDEEVDQIVDYLGDGHTEAGLADVAVTRNKLNDVILNLVSKGLVKQASEIYLRATTDIGPMLMAEVNYQNRSASSLAEVFQNVSSFHYAGMVFERMSAFDKAGEAFEKAEDFERAAYCFERSGQEPKARMLKEKSKLMPYKGKAGSSNFALSDVASQANAFGSVTDGESTAVLEVGRSGRQTAGPSLPPRKLSMPPPPVARAQGSFSMAFDEEAPDDPTSRIVAPVAGEETSWKPISETQASRPPLPVSGHDGGFDGEGDQAPTLPPPSPRLAAAPGTLDDGRAAFHKAKFFADLDFDQKNRIWNIGLTLNFEADQTVLTYNDEPKGVYVIIQGSVSCYKQVSNKEAYVDQMGEGESFGELWLLADQPTAVRFVATKATKIRVVGRDSFNELLDKDGTIARKLYKRFTMRLLKRLLKPQNPTKNQAAS